jgi:hypothetical protein
MHPVVGSLYPDENSVRLGTGFYGFRSSWLKIDGLCKVKGRTIEILAVNSGEMGRGNFRVFVEQLQAHYDCVAFLIVRSQVLKTKLPSYGFSHLKKVTGGESVDVWIWNRNPRA